jgi:hypothetical protein
LTIKWTFAVVTVKSKLSVKRIFVMQSTLWNNSVKHLAITLSISMLLVACGPSEDKAEDTPSTDQTAVLSWDSGKFDENTWGE